MKDEDNSDYAIPEQMKIHRFLEGLRSKDIKDKLYSESYDTLEEYYEKAMMFEQSNPNYHAGQKRSAPQENNKKRPRFGGNNSKNIRCFKCNQVGHK